MTPVPLKIQYQALLVAVREHPGEYTYVIRNRVHAKRDVPVSTVRARLRKLESLGLVTSKRGGTYLEWRLA